MPRVFHHRSSYPVENTMWIQLSTYLPGNPKGFSQLYVRTGNLWWRKLWVFSSTGWCQTGLHAGTCHLQHLHDCCRTICSYRNCFLQDNGITVKHRLDGNLFNQRRLNAQSKTSVTHSYELQYADDAALVSHTVDDLQQLLDGMVDVYSRAGLVVNIKYTEILQYSSALHQIMLHLFSTSKTAP